MLDLFRDSAVGVLLHKISGGRIMQYNDHVSDKEIQRYLSRQATGTSNTLTRWTSTRNPAFTDPSSRNLTRTRTKESAVLSPSDSTVVSEDKETKDLEKSQEWTIVDWSGPDDPANPQNWSLLKKCFVTGLVCFLTFCIYIGSAIYTAGIGDIERVFGISGVPATLGLTLFVFGYGLGPMFLAPMAEAPQIGRAPVYILSLIAFIALNFGVVYATNLGMLLAFRFLTGFVGSPVLATGGSSMADMWSPRKRAYAIGLWGIFAVCGPTAGPLAGGFAVEAHGWTWTIWELIWLNGFCLVLLAFTLPETSSTTILYRRAQRMRKATKDTTLKTEAEIEIRNMRKADIIIASTLRPFQLTFCEPILLATDIYLGLIYALLYCWFEAFPIAFVGQYGFDLGENGLSFLGLLIGAFAVMVPYFFWLHRVQEKQFDADGNISPENRLPPAVVGSFIIPVSIFWFGWSARSSVHWIVPIIGTAFFPMGALLLFNAILNYQGDAYPVYVGSVLAGNDLMRSGMGGAFPLFASAMFHRLGLGWGCSLLGFLSIAFIPIPIGLSRYGKRLRMSSKFARHDI